MLLTNKQGGRVLAEGANVETLKRLGWKEVASEAPKAEEVTPSPAPKTRTTRKTTK